MGKPVGRGRSGYPRNFLIPFRGQSQGQLGGAARPFGTPAAARNAVGSGGAGSPFSATQQPSLPELPGEGLGGLRGMRQFAPQDRLASEHSLGSRRPLPATNTDPLTDRPIRMGFSAAIGGESQSGRDAGDMSATPTSSRTERSAGTWGLATSAAPDVDPIAQCLEPFAAHIYEQHAHDAAWVAALMAGDAAATDAVRAAAVAWVAEWQAWSADDVRLAPLIATMAGQLVAAYRRIAVSDAYSRRVAEARERISAAQADVAAQREAAEAATAAARTAAHDADADHAALLAQFHAARDTAAARTAQDQSLAEFVGTHADSLRLMSGTVRALSESGAAWMDPSARASLTALAEAMAGILVTTPPLPSLSPKGEGARGEPFVEPIPPPARDPVAASVQLVCEAFPEIDATPRLTEIARAVNDGHFFPDVANEQALVGLLREHMQEAATSGVLFRGAPLAIPVMAVAELIYRVIRKHPHGALHLIEEEITRLLVKWLRPDGLFQRAIVEIERALPAAVQATAIAMLLARRTAAFADDAQHADAEWYRTVYGEIHAALALGAAAGDASGGETTPHDASAAVGEGSAEELEAPTPEAALEERVDAEHVTSMAQVREALARCEALLLNTRRLLHQLRTGLGRTRNLRGRAAEAWIVQHFPLRSRLGLDTVTQLLDLANQTDEQVARLTAAREGLRTTVHAPFLGRMVQEALRLRTDLARSGEMIVAVSEWVAEQSPALTEIVPGAQAILKQFQVTTDLPPPTLAERFMAAIRLLSATFGDEALRTDVWAALPAQHLMAAVDRVVERVRTAEPAWSLSQVLESLRQLEPTIAQLDLDPPALTEAEDNIVKVLSCSLIEEDAVAVRDVTHAVQRLLRLRDDAYAERALRGEDYAEAMAFLQRTADELKEWTLRQQVRIPEAVGLATLTSVIRDYLQARVGTSIDPVFFGERRFKHAASAEAVQERVRNYLLRSAGEESELDGLLLRLTIDDVIAILRGSVGQVAGVVKKVRKRPLPADMMSVEAAAATLAAAPGLATEEDDARAVGTSGPSAVLDTDAPHAVAAAAAVDLPLTLPSPQRERGSEPADTGGVTTVSLSERIADQLGIARDVWQVAQASVLARNDSLWSQLDTLGRTEFNNDSWGELFGAARRRAMRKALQTLRLLLTDESTGDASRALLADAVRLALAEPAQLVSLLGLCLDASLKKLSRQDVLAIVERAARQRERYGARVARVNYYEMLRAQYVRGGERFGSRAEAAFVAWAADHGATVVSIARSGPGEMRGADFLVNDDTVVEVKGVLWSGDWGKFVDKLNEALVSARPQLAGSWRELQLGDDAPLIAVFVVPARLQQTLRAALDSTRSVEQLSTNAAELRKALTALAAAAGTRVQLQFGLLSGQNGLEDLLVVPRARVVVAAGEAAPTVAADSTADALAVSVAEPLPEPPPPLPPVDAALSAELQAATELTAEQLMAPVVDGVPHALTTWLNAAGEVALDTANDVPQRFGALRTWLEQQAVALVELAVPIPRERVNAGMAQLLAWNAAVQTVRPFVTEVASFGEGMQRAALLACVPLRTDTLVDVLQTVEVPELPTAFTAAEFARVTSVWEAAAQRLTGHLERVMERDAARAAGELELAEGAEFVAELRRRRAALVVEELAAIRVALDTVAEPRPLLLQEVQERLARIGDLTVVAQWQAYPPEEQMVLMAQLRRLLRAMREYEALQEEFRRVALRELNGHQRRVLRDAEAALRTAATLTDFSDRLSAGVAVRERIGAEVERRGVAETRSKAVKSAQKNLIRTLGIAFPYDRAQSAVTTIVAAKGAVLAVINLNRTKRVSVATQRILDQLEACSMRQGIIGAKTMNEIVDLFADLLLAGGRLE